jgi:hypothetical protein
MKSLVIISGLTILLISCGTIDKLADNTFYNVTVLGKGMDCGNSFLIKFEDDINGLPQNNWDSIFHEINLPDKYKIVGMKIKVSIRKPNNNELKPCTAMEPAYPLIYIIEVK